MQCIDWPANVFQKRNVQSAVPPPDTSRLLMRAPGECLQRMCVRNTDASGSIAIDSQNGCATHLDGDRVLCVCLHGRRSMQQRPNQQLVIIATGRYALMIGRAFETAHLHKSVVRHVSPFI